MGKRERSLLDPLELLDPSRAEVLVLAEVHIRRLARHDREPFGALLLDALHHVPASGDHRSGPRAARGSASEDEALALDLERTGRFGVVLDAEDAREVGEEEAALARFGWKVKGFGEGMGRGGKEDRGGEDDRLVRKERKRAVVESQGSASR